MAGVERYLQDVDAARGQLQRVLDRLGEQRAHGNCTSLAYPLASSLYGEGVTWWRISICGTSGAVGSK